MGISREGKSRNLQTWVTPLGTETAGPSTTLRSGRDDNSFAGVKYLSLKLLRA
jgi:hypothetical protein